MASVRKRTLPSGETRWQVDYKDQAGKRRSKQFETKKEAVGFETQVRAAIANGTYIHAADSITVEEACRQYLEHLTVRRDTGQEMERATYRNYEGAIRLHILEPEIGIGGMKLAELKAKHVNAFRDRLLAGGRSVTRTRRILIILGFVLKHARSNELIFTNPLEGVEVKRQSRASGAMTKEAARSLKENVKRLIDAAEGDEFRTYLIVAALAGLRASEQRGLRWENVDLEAGYIRVRERADIFNAMGETKSEAGNRDVPIGPLIVNTLKRWKLQCRKSDLNLVFPTKAGGIIAHTNVHSRWFKPLCRKLGIKMRWHDLRHFAVSAWIDQGFSVKAVMEFAGHKDYRQTMERYGKLFPSEDHHKAMAAMEKRLLG
ncbi:tyrosine-type recombinase/integrase [Azospirillum sp. TSO22-1]|uniref:tyrosine-type recombinase/integrase n=1 Tax=Azospirillum sp. TSO22-1 TaxID=716789 RepID=UPI000D61DBB1|nr:tyrosine-type recombinase/integrase [Azospirillum sp. TSO22-1]PWC53263.1 integrase [Azospirillum sp. TSO22-1]